ncbi:hypothetical protein BDZ97DRAFT_1821262 [Flammula alnicola]|nr:hypothetical protein BDZ97DRAFT_1821262 [Flammula alnicola]
MMRSRDRWRDRLAGFLSFPKRLALAAARLWPQPKRRRTSLVSGWEVIAIESPEPYARPAQQVTSSNENPTIDNTEQPQPEESTDERKRYTLTEIPFSFTIQCAASELPEDIEHIIFEMAAREDMAAALHTLVFVNHRVRKWVEYVIYESVILRNAKHARLFLDGLERKHPDFAAGAVKILALPTRVSYDTSWRILKACRDIRHLSWLPTNPLAVETINLIADLPLISLRARLTSFYSNNPDFSAPLFDRLTTLFVADHQDVWKTWKWDGVEDRPKLKWIAVNLDGRLDTVAGWAPVHTLEKMVLNPYGRPSRVRLCVCYSYNPRATGDRWIHRSRETFSEERMAVLSLDHRIDEREWAKRINGERRDFEISEELVRERQTEDRRLRFQLYRTSVLF